MKAMRNTKGNVNKKKQENGCPGRSRANRVKIKACHKRNLRGNKQKVQALHNALSLTWVNA